MSRKATWIAVVVALVVAVALTALVTWRHSLSYEPKDVSFDIVSPSRTDVTVAVTMPRGDSVTCGVRVLSDKFDVVGYREAVFSSDDPGAQQISSADVAVQRKVPVRTTFQGVSGGAASCWPTP